MAMVSLYGNIPFALLIKEANSSQPTDLQAYRPDPRDYLAKGIDYPAQIKRYPHSPEGSSLRSGDGDIRYIAVQLNESKSLKFAKIR